MLFSVVVITVQYSTRTFLSGKYCKPCEEAVLEAATPQRKSPLCIPFLGIARPQSQFPHSCVCERFIYSQDRSTYFPQQNRQLDSGNT
jgi:hypothetical protein